jgi:hypothetical protein
MAKLCVLQARHSGDGWKSLVAAIQIVKQISGYYQVFWKCIAWLHGILIESKLAIINNLVKSLIQ